MSMWKRLFGKKNTPTNQQPASDMLGQQFSEKTNANGSPNQQDGLLAGQDNIQSLYAFLGSDFQQQGYDDALVNPDTAYMNQKIDAILSDLELTIKKVMTFYEDCNQQLEFLISSRARIGMVDTVDELKMKKERALRHMEKVLDMEKELLGDNRSKHSVIISYRRGFHNGLASIAHHKSGNYNF